MNKKAAIANLREAKASLLQWKSHVQGFALKLPVDARHLPLIVTDSLYGKWFYADGQSFRGLPEFDPIEATLQESFNRFQSLHRHVQSKPKSGSIFTSKAKAEAKHNQHTEELAQLVFSSINRLMENTKQLEKAATKLSDETFNTLF